MKDTFYFQHDTSARWDQKLVKVQMMHQMTGIGVYWCIVEMLYENAGYLPTEYERIAFELRTEKNVIQSIVNDFELFENDGEKFWSNNALMQFNERMNKSAKASNSVNKRWEKYKRNTTVLRTKNDPNTKEERRGENRIEENRIEIYPFDDFWNLYDKKVDKQSSERKYNKLSESDKELIFLHIPKYKISQPSPQYRKNPDTYLNNRCWEDELPSPVKTVSGGMTMDQMIKSAML